ncbi:MAG: YabP/YqfC family sporulation protein [Christensenellaceae bacterium]
MRLFNEIGGNLLRNVAPKGRCLFFTGGGGYFQGVKSFDGFSPKTVTLRFSGGSLKVTGENFSVGKFQSGDFELLGRIFSMEYFTAAALATPETIVNAAAPANRAATPEIAAQAAKDGGK